MFITAIRTRKTVLKIVAVRPDEVNMLDDSVVTFCAHISLVGGSIVKISATKN